MPHLPMSRPEMIQYGWNELDFLFVSGDAYVDHPSFGCAILTRVLENAGYRVGIIAQPDVSHPDSLLAMGRPRLGVLVSSGVVDSMVNHYTAAGRRRSEDAYSPGGLAGKRPDRAVIRYGQMVRSQLGRIPLIIGGIEASLRRFAHYDFWSRSVRCSILQDSAADLLVFGEGEQTLLTIAHYLEQGIPVGRLNALPGTAVLLKKEQLTKQAAVFLDRFSQKHTDFSGRPMTELTGSVLPEDGRHILLPSAEQVQSDGLSFAIAARYQDLQQDPGNGKVLIQAQNDRFLVQNPPQPPLGQPELDRIYALPYERSAHPVYLSQGDIPAAQEIRFSITAHRGCYGGCHFCSITHHMGRIVRSRSDRSILEEIDQLARLADFKGIINDIGGPTANFHQPACQKQRNGQVCRHRQCLFPEPCPQLEIDHGSYLGLLRQARSKPGVRKVFVRSGIRHDLVMADPDPSFLEELCQHHVSGQLKIAPEHVSPTVLAAMGKPGPDAYQAFASRYRTINDQLGLRQYLVPYFMSGHPGNTLQDAIELALYLRREHRMPEQVQDFYPTPGTISTAMFHTGLNPLTLEPIHVPDGQEKRWQRALLQPTLPGNRQAVVKALQAVGRTDLIGYGPDKLLSPLPVSAKNARPEQGSGPKKQPDQADSRDGLNKRRGLAGRPEQRTIEQHPHHRKNEGGTHHEHDHPRKRTGSQPAHPHRRRR